MLHQKITFTLISEAIAYLMRGTHSGTSRWINNYIDPQQSLSCLKNSIDKDDISIDQEKDRSD
jgi:hypothetical protein